MEDRRPRLSARGRRAARAPSPQGAGAGASVADIALILATRLPRGHPLRDVLSAQPRLVSPTTKSIGDPAERVFLLYHLAEVAWLQRDGPTFQIAYRQYHDPRVAQYLAHFGAVGDGGFKTFDSLLHPPLEAPQMARYVKVVFPKNAGGGNIGAHEIKVFAAAKAR